MKPAKWGRFFNQCRKSMESFKLLCCRLEDIRQNQLERLLDSMRHFTLHPESRPRTWAPEEFVEAVKDACRRVTAVGPNLLSLSWRIDLFSHCVTGDPAEKLASGKCCARAD